MLSPRAKIFGWPGSAEIRGATRGRRQTDLVLDPTDGRPALGMLANIKCHGLGSEYGGEGKRRDENGRSRPARLGEPAQRHEGLHAGSAAAGMHA